MTHCTPYEPVIHPSPPLRVRRTPEDFLALVAPVILGVTAGQVMPFWLRLLVAARTLGTHRLQVVASEDSGTLAALGVTLAEQYFGQGRPALFVAAAAEPATKALLACSVASWNIPFVLVTGECPRAAGPGTVQDSRGGYRWSLTELTSGAGAVVPADPGGGVCRYFAGGDTAWQALMRAPALAVEARRAVHVNIPVDQQADIWR